MGVVGDLIIRITGDTAVFDSAIDKSEIKLKGLSQTAIKSLSDLAKSFNDTDNRAKVFGKEVDVLSDKHTELKKTIEKMLSDGMKPEDAEIQKLKSEYDKLTKQIDPYLEKQKQVTEQSKKHEEQLKKTLDAVNKVGMALSVMITAPVIAGFTLAIKGFADEEAAAKRLSDAVNLAGNYTDGAAERMIAYAEALMQTTGVSHELIENLMSQAITMGRTEEEAKKLADVAVDVAARGLMPLDAAFEALQVTYEGQTIRSKALRAITGDLTESQLKAGKAVDLIGAAVKGAGVEMRATTQGGMTALKNSSDELGESFGAVLAPSVNKVVNTLIGFLDRLAAMDKGSKTALVTMLGLAAAVGPIALGIVKINQALTALAANPANVYIAIAAGVVAVGIAIAGAITKANVDNIERTAKGFGSLAKDLGLSGDAAKEFANKAAQVNIALDKYQFALGRSPATLQEFNSEMENLRKTTGLSNYEILRVMESMTGLSDRTKEFVKVGLEKEILTKNEIEYTKLLNQDANAKTAAEKEAAETALSTMKAELDFADKVEQARLYQNKLVELGIITEKEGLEAKIKLRTEEIDRITKVGQANGTLSATQVALINQYKQLNAENQAQADGRKSLNDVQQSAADDELERQKLLGIYVEATGKEYEKVEEKIYAGLKERKAINEVSLADQVEIDDALTKHKKEELDKQVKDYLDMSSKIVSILADVFQIIKDNFDRETKAKEDALDKQLKLDQEKLAKEQAATDHAYSLQLTAEDKLLSKKEQLEDRAIAKRIAAEDKALDAIQKAEDKALADKEKAKDREIADIQKKEDRALSDKYKAEDKLLSDLQKAYDKALSDKYKAEDKAASDALSARLAEIDVELQAALYAAGLATASTEEQYKAEIAAALAAGDTEKAAELQKELDKLLIIQDFEAQKKAAVDAAQAAKDAKDAERQAAADALELERYNERVALDAERQAAKDAKDAERQAAADALELERYAAGLKLDADRQAARDKKDAERLAAADKLEQDRYAAQIKLEEERYQAKLKTDEAAADARAELEKETQNKILKIKYEADHAAWLMSGIIIPLKSALAILEGFITGGILGGALATAAGIAAEVAWWLSEPKYTPLAQGGIIPARPGGTAAIIGEAGQDEAVIPLRELDRMLAHNGGGSGSGDLYLTLKISDKVLLDTVLPSIFPATRNRTVLIDGRAVI